MSVQMLEASPIMSRDGAPSRKGRVVNDPTTKASNKISTVCGHTTTAMHDTSTHPLPSRHISRDVAVFDGLDAFLLFFLQAPSLARVDQPHTEREVADIVLEGREAQGGEGARHPPQRLAFAHYCLDKDGPNLVSHIQKIMMYII